MRAEQGAALAAGQQRVLAQDTWDRDSPTVSDGGHRATRAILTVAATGLACSSIPVLGGSVTSGDQVARPLARHLVISVRSRERGRAGA